MKKTAKRKSFYTLIEILTVVVIAAILFGIGIPAFTTMIQGNTMTIAVRQFSSKIAAARAYAITNRCNVALLLVQNDGFLGDKGRYSAYRVCLVDKDNDNKFDRWIEGEDWKTLPTGVLRPVVENAQEIEDVKNYDGEGNVSKFHGIIFNKLGKLITKGNSELGAAITISLTLGRYVNSQIVNTDTVSKNSDTEYGYQDLELNHLTGKVTTKAFVYVAKKTPNP